MGNSCTSVFFLNTRAWEQQERNKTKRQTKNVRRKEWVWKEVKWSRKKSWQNIITKSKYNINKHNKALFYKIWKKYNEIQLTKKKMNLNNWKIIHSLSPINHRKNCLAICNVLLILNRCHRSSLMVEHRYCDTASLVNYVFESCASKILGIKQHDRAPGKCCSPIACYTKRICLWHCSDE